MRGFARHALDRRRCASFFSAVFRDPHVVHRSICRAMKAVRSRSASGDQQMRLFQLTPNYHFIEKRKRAYVLSVNRARSWAFGAMVVNHFTIGRWLNCGVDFTGGSLVQVTASARRCGGAARCATPCPQAEEVAAFGGRRRVSWSGWLPFRRGPAGRVAQGRHRARARPRSFGAGTFEIVRDRAGRPQRSARKARARGGRSRSAASFRADADVPGVPLRVAVRAGGGAGDRARHSHHGGFLALLHRKSP